MPGAAYLRGDGLTLRTVEEEDLPFLRDVINDPAVRRYLSNRPPVNLEAEREFFENVVCADESVDLLVCVDGERAGIVGLEVNDADGSGEIGFFLAEAFWGEGHGTEVARLMTDYAFRERRVHRVTARVVEGNAASRRVWEKLGFRHEATFREATFHEGEYVDSRLYAVLEDEWLGEATEPRE